MNSPRLRSDCPVNYTLEVLGDSWSLLILRDMFFRNKRQYGEFLASDEGISTNILADRLNKLQKAEIVRREKHPTNNRMVVYTPTEQGKDLLDILMDMIIWGDKYEPQTAAPKEMIRRIQRDREAYKREILKGFSQSN